MSIITKNHKVGIFAIFIASALMLGTISVSGLDSAFATDSKDKDRHDNKGKDKAKDNESEQEIEMSQSIKQDSQCIAGGFDSKYKDKHEQNGKDRDYKNKDKHEQNGKDQNYKPSVLNCNNVGLNLQFNKGNQALGQQ